MDQENKNTTPEEELMTEETAEAAEAAEPAEEAAPEQKKPSIFHMFNKFFSNLLINNTRR